MKITPLNRTKPAYTGNLQQEISKEVLDSMPKSVRFFEKYKNKMGERQDILLNAIGTGVVSPIFIEHNPFSDADKKTKRYSALRQTAIALTAVVIQAGVTIPIDKHIDKLVKAGKLGEKFSLKNSGNLTALKRVTGLAMAFATIPISCWILNKTYPPFMKKFFPSLCVEKNQNQILKNSPKLYAKSLDEFAKGGL